MKKNSRQDEFAEKILEHMDSLYNLAYRLCQNRTEAYDLVQEASLRAFRFYHTFEQGTNFKAWTMTILRNIFINKYRKQSREPVHVHYDGYEGGLDPLMSISTPKGYEKEIFGESLQTSLNQLSEELRTTVILFYVDELSYKEIAQVMNCPIGTVMSRLHMAKLMLRKLLNESAKGEKTA